MKRVFFLLLCLFIFSTISIPLPGGRVSVFSAPNRTWSGTIYDIRTGQPMPGVEVKAGVKGRVDPFKNYRAVTDAQGRFSISWDEESWTVWGGDNINHYLRINSWQGFPDNHSYFPLTLIRRQPTLDNTIYLTPRGAFIKGRLLSSETGNPLSSTNVQLLVPGAVKETVKTDLQGYFTFKPVIAYHRPPSEIFEVFPEKLSDEQPRDPGKHQSYCLSVNVYEFENIEPERKGDEWAESLPLQSSYTDAIHTYVTLRVAKKGNPRPTNPVNSSIRDKDGKITIVLTIGSKNAYVNQQLVVLDVAPFIDSGRTFVPFRFVGESLGAQVGYTTDASGRVATVTYQLGSTSIILYIGRKDALVNGRTVYLDVAPKIVQGRTVIPLRFVTEALGCKVDWDGQTMKVTITYPA